MLGLLSGYALVHVSKEPASASQARLDFIRHQQDPVLAAEFSRLFQESRGRDHDPGFALHRFHQKRAGVGIDRLPQSRDVAERNYLEARCEGAKTVPVLLVGGEANDGSPICGPS